MSGPATASETSRRAFEHMERLLKLAEDSAASPFLRGMHVGMAATWFGFLTPEDHERALKRHAEVTDAVMREVIR